MVIFKKDSNMTEILEDVFDIVHRLKAIDEHYSVYRNHKKHRFDIYRTYGLNKKLELTWDKPLDSRLISKVLMTRKENIEKLIKQIEIDNEKLQKQENDKLFNKIMEDVQI